VTTAEALALVAAKDPRYRPHAAAAAEAERLGVRPAPPATMPVDDRYALPLCRYEGIVIEYAACGCEDKHVRWCDHPEHGADIDRCHRGPVRGSPLTACETCAHRAAPEKTDV